jgi:HAMP domain-containing protein
MIPSKPNDTTTTQAPGTEAGPALPPVDDDATRPLSRDEIDQALKLIKADTQRNAEREAERQAAEAEEPMTARIISPQLAEHMAMRTPAAATSVVGVAVGVAPTSAPADGMQAEVQANASVPDLLDAVADADAPTVLMMRPPPQQPRADTVPGASSTNSLPGGASVMGDLETKQVGRYEVRSRLGRGGMATVYRAHDPSIGRDLAIKFLHASLCEDEECRMRFLREARASGGLSHPNIVVVHDVGEIQRRPYMAMELIDGAPLSETLERTKQMPIADVVSIGIQLARALEYAHVRGIVHRDIKPGNIMLLRDGHTIKVADFGIAHIDDGGSEQRTVVGAVMGTPQYMSPEQTRGDKVDGRSDLFSAGIVLYQMLAGERPFRGESLVAVATKIANDDPPALNSKRPDVPASLRRVVERCLAKQPAQRHQSGRELAEALLKVQAELDEAARERDKPRIVPLRVKWAATMACIVAVVMGITTTIVTWRQNAAMTAQVTDYGASLARFIAAQNAASVLGDEWEPVEVAVQELMKTSNFERVSVVDLTGTVRVSSQSALIGKPYTPLGTAKGNVAHYQVGDESVLGFEAPVLFGGKKVGSVALGIPEAPLTAVARLSISLMLVLVVVTVLAVAIAMYFVANWFAKPIRLVGESMAEIGKGRFDHRIAEERKDEFGQLFRAFDAMAEALQKREPQPALPPATTLPPVAHTISTASANHEAAPAQTPTQTPTQAARG